MSKVDTLTAYKCSLLFLQRNNPLLNEQREAIRNGASPDYSFSDFFADYSAFADTQAIGDNTERAIQLKAGSITTSTTGSVKKWCIIPSSGKYGKSMTVIDPTGQQHHYGPNSSALYKHHVFAYEYQRNLIMIFHRHGGSGCKSVFLETANQFLKGKGLRLDMDLILPLSDSKIDATPTKLILRAKRNIVSSDIADNIGEVKGKTVVIKELALNLKAKENYAVLETYRNMQLGRITKEDAFATIKAEVENGNDYNDAEIKLQIGRSTHKIRWEEFEKNLGAFDITDRLQGFIDGTQGYNNRLEQLSDEYFGKIMESKEV